MKQNKGFFIGIAVVLIVVIAGVVLMSSDKKATTTKSSSSSSSASTSNAVSTDSVKIQNYMFGPMAIKVKVGTTVTWTNEDMVKHNIVSDNTSPDSPNGPLIGQGETYKYTFKKAGTYTYHCDPHPYMHGIVQVTD